MKENATKEKVFVTQSLLAVLLLFFIVVIPLIINSLMMNMNIPTSNGLDSANWLSFWGGYIGSAFGIITSLSAFLFTYIQNEKQHNTTRKEIRDTARLQIIPIIDVTLGLIDPPDVNGYVTGFSLLDSNFQMIIGTDLGNNVPFNESKRSTFMFTNIGLSTLINLRIEYNDKVVGVGNLSKEQSRLYLFFFPNELSGKCNHFSFIFEDLLNHTYKQEFDYTFDNSSKVIMLTVPTYPQLL